MFNVVLVSPEIPPNTGNIIRLCANTGAALHLIEPLGFTLEDKQLQRAGLDYHEYATLKVWPDWLTFLHGSGLDASRFFAMTTKGAQPIAETRFRCGDTFVFGRESAGLPEDLLTQFADERRIRLPMRPHNRSLNLSNAVAVTVFEAWRQNGYVGGL